jgi:hypothetical protein
MTQVCRRTVIFNFGQEFAAQSQRTLSKSIVNSVQLNRIQQLDYYSLFAKVKNWCVEFL